jgi:hypothetical protein
VLALLVGASCSSSDNGEEHDAAVDAPAADLPGADIYIGPDGPPCNAGWQTLSTGSTETLLAIWSGGPTEIYVSGTSSTLLHFDGAAWNGRLSSDSGDLNAVWGTGPDSVFAASSTGMLYSYDGTDWSGMGPEPVPMRGIWGSSASNVFAVGGDKNGTIVQYDGMFWSKVYQGTLPDDYLHAVWGDSATSALAVGNASTAFRYNGTYWVQVVVPPDNVLRGVWGTSETDIFAVGDGGAILRFDGTVWEPMTSGSTATLHDVWGKSSSEIYAVGAGGTLLEFDGTSWTKKPVTTTEDLHGVRGVGDVLYLVGANGTVLRSCGM